MFCFAYLSKNLVLTTKPQIFAWQFWSFHVLRKTYFRNKRNSAKLLSNISAKFPRKKCISNYSYQKPNILFMFVEKPKIFAFKMLKIKSFVVVYLNIFVTNAHIKFNELSSCKASGPNSLGWSCPLFKHPTSSQIFTKQSNVCGPSKFKHPFGKTGKCNNKKNEPTTTTWGRNPCTVAFCYVNQQRSKFIQTNDKMLLLVAIIILKITKIINWSNNIILNQYSNSYINNYITTTVIKNQERLNQLKLKICQPK